MPLRIAQWGLEERRRRRGAFRWWGWQAELTTALLRETVERENVGIVVATHDVALAEMELELKEGLC